MAYSDDTLIFLMSKQKNTYICGGEENVQSFVLTDDSVWPEMASPYTGNNDY